MAQFITGSKGVDILPSVPVSLLIDSRDRDYAKYPTSHTFTVKLPKTFRNIVSARLVTVEMPSSYYVFTAARGNTSITLTCDGTTLTATIPDGNYTSSSMAAALQASLASAFSTPFTCTVDAITQRLSISAAAIASISVLTTSTGPMSATWALAGYLGFAMNVAASGITVIAPRMMNTNPENYILVDIPELGRIQESAMNGGGGAASTACFAKIPLNVPSYNIVYYDKVITWNALTPAISKLDKITVSYRFHDGTPVDLQYMENSMTLELTVVNDTHVV